MGLRLTYARVSGHDRLLDGSPPATVYYHRHDASKLLDGERFTQHPILVLQPCHSIFQVPAETVAPYKGLCLWQTIEQVYYKHAATSSELTLEASVST
jgi:hypothetical protein